MAKLAPIVVLGAGSWGTALALHLSRNKQHVLLWGHEPALMSDIESARENKKFLAGFPFPDTIDVSCDLAHFFTLLEGASHHDVLVAVPSYVFEEVLKKLSPFQSEKMRLIWATKGLSERGELLHEVVKRQGFQSYGVLSGPSFAKEVAGGQPTAVSFASNSSMLSDSVVERFHTPDFRVYTSDDIVGLELGGSIKNILAIAVALADGLGFGMNAKAALMTRGIAELRRLALAMGAHAETPMGLSGVGDVILTCTDNQSRNRRFGLYLAEGLSIQEAEEKVGQVVEGKRNIEQVMNLFARYQIEGPICEMVYNIIKHHHDPRAAVELLLARPQKDEF